SPLHLPRSTHLPAMAATSIVVFAARPSPALGLPRLRLARAEGLRCRVSKKASSALAPMVAKGAPLLSKASGMASAAPMLASALALVDEGMSGERAGQSNDLLGWALLLVLGLVLCFYAVYSTTFDDDDDRSGGGGIMLCSLDTTTIFFFCLPACIYQAWMN
uniref:PSII 6.1 kDa protein n=5 Tax=Triticinae TaxID=1648030 RepID=A0A452ZIS6_AEGTS